MAGIWINPSHYMNGQDQGATSTYSTLFILKSSFLIRIIKTYVCIEEDGYYYCFFQRCRLYLVWALSCVCVLEQHNKSWSFDSSHEKLDMSDKNKSKEFETMLPELGFTLDINIKLLFLSYIYSYQCVMITDFSIFNLCCIWVVFCCT